MTQPQDLLSRMGQKRAPTPQENTMSVDVTQAAAWMYKKGDKVFINTHHQPWKADTGWGITPLYAHQPQPTAATLMDSDYSDCNAAGNLGHHLCAKCEHDAIGEIVAAFRQHRLKSVAALMADNARLREALGEIRNTVDKRQLPITAQVWALADTALKGTGHAG